MSINVIIGSDPDDLNKIKKTIDILKFVNNIDNKNELTVNTDSIDDLVDWYSSLLNIIMYVGNSEDYQLQPLES
jgi:hypothetical protein